MENFGNYTNMHLRNIEQQLFQFFNYEEPKKQDKKKIIPNTDLFEFKYTKIRKPYTTFLNKNRKFFKDGYSFSAQNSRKNTEENLHFKPELQVNLPYITQKQFYNNQKKKVQEKDIHSYFKDKKNLFNYKNVLKQNKKTNIEEKQENVTNIKKSFKEPKFKFNNIHIKQENPGQKEIINSYYTISVAGGKGMFKKINQDNYLNLSKKELNYPVQIFGVFDGHGPKGQLISKYLNTYFTNYFTKSETAKYFQLNFPNREKDTFTYFKIRNYESIKSLFNACEKNLHSELKYPTCDLSGSTCNLVFIFDSKNIICANIGDTRSIMIKKNNEIIQLSRDHKPDLQDEKDRILSMEGRIERKPKNAKFGPLRIWLKGQNIPGLTVSRSFGDLIAKSIGVIAEPEINDWDLSVDDCKCVVIASDGVWEFVSNEKVRDIVISNENKDNKEKICAEEIMEYAKKVWIMNNEAVDDITVTVIYFN